MKVRLIAACFAISGLLCLAAIARAQNISATSLGSVGLIMHGEQDDAVPVGIAFFVEVPSLRFKGKSFVYLITARHVLLDERGRALGGLWLSMRQSGSSRAAVLRLPPANQWFFSPGDSSLDLAALPYAPTDASFTPVLVGDLIGGSGDTELPADRILGSDVYYISLTGDPSGGMPVEEIHFGHVSVAVAVQADIAGVGIQRLLFVEGLSAPQLSGAPIFLHGKHTMLFGMVEARASIPGAQASPNLIGVLPAAPIAVLARAMAAEQDRRSTPAGR
jgi:hypothetical protein